MKKIYLLVLALPLLFVSCGSDDDSPPSFSDNTIIVGDNELELNSGFSTFFGTGLGEEGTYNTDLTLLSNGLELLEGGEDDLNSVDFEAAVFYIEAFSPENSDDLLEEGTYEGGNDEVFTFSEAIIVYVDGNGGEVSYIVTNGTLVIENSERLSDTATRYELEFTGTSTSGVDINVFYKGELTGELGTVYYNKGIKSRK